jgi:hypothetical protein
MKKNNRICFNYARSSFISFSFYFFNDIKPQINYVSHNFHISFRDCNLIIISLKTHVGIVGDYRVTQNYCCIVFFLLKSYTFVTFIV